VWGVLNSSGSGWHMVFQNRGEAIHNGASFPNVFGYSAFSGGVAQDYSGQTYIVDLSQNAVTRWASDGSCGVNLFNPPNLAWGIAVDPIRQRIFVSMPSANQVGVYNLNTFQLITTLQ